MSNTYLITYDNNTISSENLTKLTKNIKSFNGWAHPLPTIWLVKSQESTTEIRSKLRSDLDPSDRLLVLNITGDYWASVNLSDEVLNWMQKI